MPGMVLPLSCVAQENVFPLSLQDKDAIKGIEITYARTRASF
jgi:hypothetical protein